MLKMVPLKESDADEEEGSGKVSSATQFFALPVPKRSTKSEPEPAPAPAPAAAPPPGPPPGAYPMGHPGMMPGGPMGIQGPVASGPVAMGPMMGQYPSMQSMPQNQGGDPDSGRAQSFRVFGIVIALVGVVCAALLATVVLVVIGLNMNGGGNATSNSSGPVAIAPPPKPAGGRPVDTGSAKTKAKSAPSPQPSTSAPRPSSSGTSAPRPAPAPAAPKAPTGPAAVTFKCSGECEWTSVEVKCEGGFRERGSFTGGVAVVANVPIEKCDAFFKGGPPGKVAITGGQTKTCSYAGSVVCK